jgi:hypothetical protein
MHCSATPHALSVQRFFRRRCYFLRNFLFHGGVSQSTDHRYIGVIEVEGEIDGVHIAMFDAQISPKQRLTRIY